MRRALLTLLLVAATACGGTIEPGGPAEDPGPLPDEAPEGEGAPGPDVPDEGPVDDGAAGMCLEGTVDCVDTPGLEPPAGDDMPPPDIPLLAEPFEDHRVVEPRDVVDDRSPAFLQWASGEGTSLTVGYSSGVEPCFVTAEVIVSELPDVVSVTVLVGPERGSEDAVCIMLAELLAVEVELEEPVGDRRLVDGARATPEDLGA